jgi:predicted site-specific integrase-resolvase
MQDAQYVPIEDVGKKFSVSLSTVRSWLRQGFIPKSTYIKVGNTYRFDVDAVVKALTAQPDDEVVFKEAVPKVDKEIVESPVQLELNFNPDEDL